MCRWHNVHRQVDLHRRKECTALDAVHYALVCGRGIEHPSQRGQDVPVQFTAPDSRGSLPVPVPVPVPGERRDAVTLHPPARETPPDPRLAALSSRSWFEARESPASRLTRVPLETSLHHPASAATHSSVSPSNVLRSPPCSLCFCPRHCPRADSCRTRGLPRPSPAQRPEHVQRRR